MDRLDARLDEWERKLERRLSATEGNPQGQTPTHRTLARAPAALSSQGTVRRPERPAFRLGTLTVQEGASLAPGLETSVEDLLQLAAWVFNAPHVQTNEQYRRITGEVRFLPDLEDPTINAYAGLFELDGETGVVPCIVLLGGAVRFSRLAALAVAADRRPTRSIGAPNMLRRLIGVLGPRIVETQGRLDSPTATDLAHAAGLEGPAADNAIERLARSLAAGMNIGVIAHELGHHALGHTLGVALNPSISRNQEREADSFAASVISSSPFADYLVIGPILWNLLWVWCEHAAGFSVATTHPLARERLMDFVRANAETAAELGFDEKNLAALLP